MTVERNRETRLVSALTPGMPVASPEAAAGRVGADAVEPERIADVLELLPGAVALLDAADRFKAWNGRYADLCEPVASLLAVGLPFVDLLRAYAASFAGGTPAETTDGWLAEQLRMHDLPSGIQDIRRPDGRWIRTDEHRLAGGGRMLIRIDVTAAKERETSLDLLFQTNPIPMLIFDRETLAIVAANAATLSLCGVEGAASLPRSLTGLFAPGERDVLCELLGDAAQLDPSRLWNHEGADGRTRLVTLTCRPLVHLGAPAGLAVLVDLTEKHQIEHELQRTRAFLDTVVQSIPTGVFVKDMEDQGRYVLYNQACADIVGRSRTEIVGRTDRDLFSASEAARFVTQDQAIIQGARAVSCEEPLVRASDGATLLLRTTKVPIHAGGPRARFVLGVSEDITQQRESDARLAHLAHHDALTDLPNRVLLRLRMQDAIAQAARRHEIVAVHCLDLDAFKAVNDRYGHAFGDLLLKGVCDRLMTVIRHTDMAARLGGDEFAIVQTLVDNTRDVAILAERLAAALAEPFAIDGQQIRIGTSIGIALAPQDGSDPDLLLKCADVALYRAKEEGRNAFRFFERAMNTRVQLRRAIEQDLRQAVRKGEFELMFQPVVDLRSGLVAGCEALVRWQHPERGLVPPADFVTLAEQTGLIVPLGQWVLRTACRAAAGWPGDTRVSVNLSAPQLRSPRFVETVGRTLEEIGLRPERLEFEIGEPLMSASDPSDLALLRQLRETGVQLSLDDFGKGYASISGLRTLSFSRVKMDRSFVQDLGPASENLVLIRAIVGLGQSLGIATVAKGVETGLQRDQLIREGFDEGQGFFFSPPCTAPDVTATLAPAGGIGRAA